MKKKVFVPFSNGQNAETVGTAKKTGTKNVRKRKIFVAPAARQKSVETASFNNPGPGFIREEKSAWTKKEIENFLNKGDLIGMGKDDIKNILIQKNIKFVDAEFQTQGQFNDVAIKIPPIVDNCIKQVASHYCALPEDKELNGLFNVILIPEHYCRTFIPVKGIPVFRHFFTEPAMLGLPVVADMEIQLKTNWGDGKQSVCINYTNIRPKEEAKAEYIEKLNAASGQIKIPGTDRFVAIEPIKKKN